jgi:nucleoside-diphosphate-sugar epimerase
MKIAITGHSAGIGKSFAAIFQQQGHEIVGLSKRDGNNIRAIPRIVQRVVDCDMFINNAQSGYAQTELLYKIWESWQGQKDKIIWVISTIMTQTPVDISISGQNDLAMSEYRNQKIALEEAVKQLRFKKGSPTICLIRPGAVATQPYKQAGVNAADVDVWCQTVYNYWNNAAINSLQINEISLGFNPRLPVL